MFAEQSAGLCLWAVKAPGVFIRHIIPFWQVDKIDSIALNFADEFFREHRKLDGEILRVPEAASYQGKYKFSSKLCPQVAVAIFASPCGSPLG